MITFLNETLYPQFPRGPSSKQKKPIAGGDGARSSAETNATQNDGGRASSHEKANERQISIRRRERSRTPEEDYQPSPTDSHDDDSTSEDRPPSRDSQQESGENQPRVASVSLDVLPHLHFIPLTRQGDAQEAARNVETTHDPLCLNQRTYVQPTNAGSPPHGRPRVTTRFLGLAGSHHPTTNG